MNSRYFKSLKLFLANKKMIFLLLILITPFLLITGCEPEQDVMIKVTFVNNSGYADNETYVFITGFDPKDASKKGYYDFFSKDFVSPRVDDITQMTATLKEIEYFNEGKKTIPIPSILSGRLYFSYGANFDTLNFDCVNGEPGFATPSDALLYDKIEFDTHDKNVLNLNTTNVDFFSLPFTFSAQDKNTGKTVTHGFDIKREVIFDAFDDIPDTPGEPTSGNNSIFKNLVLKTADNSTILRVIAPDKVPVPAKDKPDPESGGWNGDFYFFSYFWNDYIIDHCWVPNREITLTYNGIDYVGTVDDNGETLTFTKGDDTIQTFSRPAYLPRPLVPPLPYPPYTAEDILQNHGHIIFGGAGEYTAGILAPIVNSAIQRGVMHLDGGEWSKSENFYTGKDGAPVNYYAKILHDHAMDGQCYAISYDDGFGYDTSIYVKQGGEYTITLKPAK